MKLRIKGNSLRLRLGPAEVDRLLVSGRIEETIRFAADPEAKLTYALELGDSALALSIRHQPGEVAVILARETASQWSGSDAVTLAGEVSTGDGALEVLVEKDFACLHRDESRREDTFPNPQAGTAC